MNRLDQVLGGRPVDDRFALERAAVLGHDVASAEWERACAVDGLSVRSDLLEALLDERLVVARRDPDGFSFVHGMLRETLERGAVAAGRIAAHHAACASVLREAGTSASQRRLGLHLFAAGDWTGCLAPLARAAERRLHLGDATGARHLCALREAALERSGRAGPEAATGHFLRLTIAEHMGHLAEAQEWTERALQALGPDGAVALRCQVLRRLGLLRLHRGDHAGAAAPIEEAVALADAHPEVPMTQRAAGWRDLAAVASRIGDAMRAEELLRRVLAAEGVYALVRDGAAVELATLFLHDGRLAEARHWADRARQDGTAHGFPFVTAYACNLLGSVATAEGTYEEAVAAFRESVTAYTAVGSSFAAYPMVNLAGWLARLGRWSEADDAAREVAERLTALGQPGVKQVLLAVQVAIAAGQGDWVDARTHAEALASTGVLSPDAADLVALASTVSRRADQLDVARILGDLVGSPPAAAP